MSGMEQWERELKDLSLAGTGEDEAAREAAEKEFEQRLRKAIDRRIRNICLRTVAVVLAALVVMFLGISPVMNLVCPTPERLEKSGVSLTKYLRVYYETIQPYTEIAESIRELEKRGFGRYTVHFQVIDHTAGSIVVGPSNAAAEFAYGEYRITEAPTGTRQDIRSILVNRFSMGDYDKEGILQRFSELPASSKIYLSVAAKEPVAVQELREAEFDVNWVEIESGSKWRGGLSLGFVTSLSGEDWRRDMDDQQLRQTYLDNLELLMAEPGLINGLDFPASAEDGSIGGTAFADGMAVVQEAYDTVAAQTGPLMTRRFCISGDRDAIIAFLEEAELVSVMTDEIKLI